MCILNYSDFRFTFFPNYIFSCINNTLKTASEFSMILHSTFNGAWNDYEMQVSELKKRHWRALPSRGLCLI